MKNKTLIALITTVLLIIVLTAGGYEEEGPVKPVDFSDYVGVATINVSLSNSSGNAHCRCEMTLIPGYRAEMTIQLTSTTNTYSVSGTGSLVADRTWTVPTSGTYKTVAIVHIYDNSGSMVGYFHKYSPAVTF